MDLHFFFDLRVVKASSNHTFCSMESVPWVSNSLKEGKRNRECLFGYNVTFNEYIIFQRRSGLHAHVHSQNKLKTSGWSRCCVLRYVYCQLRVKELMASFLFLLWVSVVKNSLLPWWWLPWWWLPLPQRQKVWFHFNTLWFGATLGNLRSVMCSEKFPHLQPVILTCLLASTPTSLSPSLVKATTEGVVLDPSAFSITLGFLPSITATHELVVPRSIPITVPFTSELCERTEERAVMNIGAHTANVDSFLALHAHFYHEK